MSNGYEYLRAVTVASVGGGGITDEDGRFLRMIGNLPVKAGDRVWTDGRIVYGHVPVRQNVNLVQNKPGVPIFGIPWAGYILPGERVHEDKKHKINSVVNWGYNDRHKIYGNNNFTQIGSEHGFYLDVFCDDGNVYTAEFYDDISAVSDSAEIIRNQNNPPMYYETNVFSKIENGEWINQHEEHFSKNYGNACIILRKNGITIGRIQLWEYKTARRRMMQMYDKYANNTGRWIPFYVPALDDPDWVIIPPTYVINQQIWCSVESTQVLHFHFKKGGTWEMIILSQVCGAKIHGDYTKDGVDEYCELQEYNVTYTVRVNSEGGEEILQEFLSPLYRYRDDKGTGLDKEEVLEGAVSKFPTFIVDFDGVTLKTDLKTSTVAINNVNIASTNFSSAKYFWAASYSSWGDVGEQRPAEGERPQPLRLRRTDMSTGVHQYFSWNGSIVYGVASTGDAYGIKDDYVGKKISPAKNGLTYFGRLSVYELSADTYIATLFYNFALLIKEGKIVNLTDCTFNMNLEKLKSRNGQQIKTINDLIADVTARKPSKTNS